MITRLSLPRGLVNNGAANQLGAGNLFTTGKVFYVDSTNGSDGNSGATPAQAVATIGQAQTLATASVGDMVVVMPGYTETRTTALTLSKAGVSYIGLGNGLLRPTITGNGTINAISITGDNVTLSNFQFPAPSTDDQTSDINVAAAGAVISNTYHIGSTTAKNKTNVIVLNTGGDDALIEGVNIYNTVVDVAYGIKLAAAVARPVIRGCNIQGTFSTAAIGDAATATLALVENNLFKNTKAATAVVDLSTGNSTGVFRFNHVSGRHTTLASNVAAGTGMDFFENRVVEEAAVNGAVIPAVDVD